MIKVYHCLSPVHPGISGLIRRSLLLLFSFFATVFAPTDLQVSLAYDVDVSDAGMLGAGAYGTVLAAVHRSTGRQVSTLPF